MEDQLDPTGGLGQIGSMLSGISPWGIFWSLLFSTFGYIVYKRGRKNQDIPMIICGGALMFYSYFTPNAIWSFIVGSGLCIWAYDRW